MPCQPTIAAPIARRDVVVAGRDVGDERAERVERRLVADLLLAAHVHLELVQRDVAGALDHHLHVALPRAQRQLAERVELGELRGVGGVGDRARPQAVAERDRDVVLAADLEDLVEALVERVLALVVDHPAREQPAAARDDAGDAVLAERQVLEPHAGVDRHVVDALARLALDDLEQALGREVLGVLDALDRLVDRHGADRHGRRVEDRLARLVDPLAGREVHDRVGAPALRRARSFSTSSSSDDVVGELPMFALIFTRAFRPIAIGSSAAWWTLAGMIIRPRATSSRTSSRVELLALGDALHLAA